MNHKLDEEVEDILQHYGIKGMRWDVRRTPEEIAADAQAGVDAVGEALDSDEVNELRERFGDIMDDGKELISKFSKKLSKVDDKAIKLGKGLFSKFKNNPLSLAYKDAKRAVKEVKKGVNGVLNIMDGRPPNAKRSYSVSEADKELRRLNRARTSKKLARRNYEKSSLRNDPIVGDRYDY